MEPCLGVVVDAVVVAGVMMVVVVAVVEAGVMMVAVVGDDDGAVAVVAGLDVMVVAHGHDEGGDWCFGFGCLEWTLIPMA